MNPMFYAEALKNLIPEKYRAQCTMIERVTYIPTPHYLFKIELHGHGQSSIDGYDGIDIHVLHRIHGEVDCVVLHFPSYINDRQYTLVKRLLPTSNSNQKVYWENELSDMEVAMIQHYIEQYLQLWMEVV